MVDGGSCAPVTDYFSYANRQWLMTDPLSLSGLVYGQCSPCSAPPSGDLVITAEVCGNTGGSEVRMTGPIWNWDPTTGPIAVDNMDGTYTFTLSPAPTTDMEYLLILDGVQEDLIQDMVDGGSCAPVTDYFSYANRQWLMTDPLSLSGLVYGQCSPCSAPPSGDLVITAEVCGNTGGSEVRMTGPIWNWDPTTGPIAVDNMDGTYTFTLSPAPTTDMEYLLILDGVQEDLIQDMVDGGSCAPVTDYFSYANRQWLMTDPLSLSGLVYGQCSPCSAPPSGDLVITAEVCGNTGGSEVRMTGPIWNWDPTTGPIAVDNMDGTYTFTLSPAPTTDMEYLLILDGVQEDLIQDMVDGGSCAPVTDYFSYANRQWLMTDPLSLSGLVYGQCSPCSAPPSGDLVITAEVCGNTGGSEVRMTGPIWNWDPTTGPIAVDNMDGTYTFTLSPAPTTDMEYLLILDGVQEDLIQDMVDGGSCAPVTDYFSYANRQWLMTDPLSLSGLVYGQCSPCSAPPSGDLVITAEVCGNTGGSEVRMTGPIWNWDPTTGPIAVDNMDGTYTFTLSPAPTTDMEYLLILDGVQEDLIQDMVDGGSCAPVTDYFSYANRQWLMTDPLSLSGLVYGQCSPCSAPPSGDLVITAEVCGNTGGSEVRMTGPIWNWDPTTGPIAVDNMDGTYTFTLSPAPTTDMEYLLILDGVQEDLIQDMVDGGSCAPVTDYFSYANRQWLMTDPLSLSGLVYGQCSPCSAPPSGDLVITAEVCGNTGGSEVRMTGPIWNWDPTTGPIAVDNMDGTYTFTLSPAPTTDMEYLLILDGVQEDLIQEMVDGGSCAPVTDYFSYANRQWLMTDPLSLSGLVYGQCSPCSAPPSGDLVITAEVCGNTGGSEVRMTGPIWNWDPTTGPIAVDNMDGTYTFTLSPAPTTDMEYLLILDGVQEDLIQDMVDGGSCAPVTDYFSYANRKWFITDSLSIDAIYNRCVPCSYPDISITTEICDTVGVSTVKILRPPNWDWNNAKEGISNGDGTWTFTYSPAPTDSLEYRIVVDGVEENLIQEMIDGANCAPITDYSSYANRLWQLSDGSSIVNTYNTCADCSGSNDIFELSLDFKIYPNPATNSITIKNAPESYAYSIYNSIGSLMIKGYDGSQIDISSLENGIYFVVINSDNSKTQASFVKN